MNFFALYCSECSAQLGRYYISGPVSKDILLNHFTLDVESITSYEVGRVETIGVDPVDANESMATHNNSIALSADEIRTNGEGSVSNEEELLKVQHMILDLVCRVSELERIIATGDFPVPPPQFNSSSPHKRNRM